MHAAKGKNALNAQTKIVTLLICLLPLLRYYIPGLKPLMFSDAAQLYLLFIGIASGKKRCSEHDPVKNSLLIYGSYAVFATLLSAVYMPVYDVSSNITTIMRLWIFILIIYFTLDSYFDRDLGFRIALIIATANSCTTIVQLFLFKVLGIKTSLLLPFLEAEAGYSNENVFNLRVFRPTGLFYEPAQSVYITVPLLFIMLFSVAEKNKPDSKKTNILYSVFLTAGMISSESGASAVIALAIWVLFVLYYIITSNTANSILKSMLLFLVFTIALPFIFRLEFFSTAFTKGTNLTGGSGRTRIFRGFLTWIQFPFGFQIFGIGYANYSIYVKYIGFSTQYNFVQDVGYTNGAVQILSGLGSIGAFIVLFYFYRTFKLTKNDLPSRLLILYLGFSLFYSTIFLGVYFIIYMAFIFSRTQTEIPYAELDKMQKG